MHDDQRFMARAIELAWRGLYTTQPNPRVGCVLVKDGAIVGEGWHRKAGEPHAERNALADAGANARGATAYVTLEPCSHHGRTPPCADGLIEAGVARVVAAMTDPNPQVAGSGMARLAEAGIVTETGVLENDARALNPGFIKRMTSGRPYVRCKMAMSLDGRTAMANGDSKWITGQDARRDVQRLRARSDAILTGIGTVLADDPSMNVRLDVDELPGVESEAYLRQPLRVVLDRRLRLPLDARMLSLDGQTVVITDAVDMTRVEPLLAAGARVTELPAGHHGVDLGIVLDYLASRELNEVLIEAGPTLAGAALATGIIDELVIYMAPHLMGDAARGLFHLPGLEQMANRIDLSVTDIRAVGPDWRITAHPKTA
jgi:diaminohydroxyphosphoribosylaminopyrimidine deaminase/5-amino-6-(5-phosphoribosylamino)uracil reductase